MTTIKIAATQYHIEATAVLETTEEAVEFVALFPKSVKMYAGRLGQYEGPAKGYAQVRVTLTANGSNGGANETGIKRINSLLKVAKKNNIETIYSMTYENSISEDEFYAKYTN
jgi:uncharacterized protein YggU (UPF0235/DUF167 family)